MAKNYDIVVIGAGPGGYVAAIRAAQLGKRVCVVEMGQERLGGVCLNQGCIPAKGLLNSAHFLDITKEAESCGVGLKVEKPDLAKIISSALNSSAQLRNGIKYLFKKNNIDLVIGRARFSLKKSVIVSNAGKEEEIKAGSFIIATGSRPKILAGLEPDNERIITSDGVFKLKTIPKSLLIIGGGAIGVEFATVFASLGSEVTIVEVTGQLLPLEDEEIAREILKYLNRRRIEVLLESKVARLAKKANSIDVRIKAPGSEINKEFDYVLLCVGRRPNCQELGLDKIGIETEKEFIKVNERLQTTLKNIYAVGDCINTPMLAHVASAEGILASEAICGIRQQRIDYSSVPSVLYSQMQAASVGLTEKAAREEGLDIVVAKHFYRSSGKAVLLHKPEGFIKIVAQKKTGKIIGVHIVGIDASELIHEFVVAKNNNLRAQDIAHSIHAHPTLSELAVEAAKAVFDKPIHG